MDVLTPENIRQPTQEMEPAPFVASGAAATAAAVLAGGVDAPRVADDQVLQNIIYKLIAFQGWLSRFSDEQVRTSFLSGFLGVRSNTVEMLRSLDCIREMMLPLPARVGGSDSTTALSGVNFFTNFLTKSDEEPLDRAGKPFPVRMSYRNWAVHLGQYSVSSFWNTDKTPDLAPSVRPKDGVKYANPCLVRADRRVNHDDPIIRSKPVSDESDVSHHDLIPHLPRVPVRRPKYSAWPLEPEEKMYHPITNTHSLYDDVVDDLEWLNLKPKGKSSPYERNELYQSKFESGDHCPKTSGLPFKGSDVRARPQETLRERPSKADRVRHASSDDMEERDCARPQGSEWYDMISQIRFPKEAVAPRIFDGKDGYSLKDFLLDYESFFDRKYAGSERQKSQLLGQYLGGSALRAYNAMDGSRLLYAVLKPELLDWYKGEKSSLRIRSESEFRKARMSSDDTLKIYALKLERLASQAFSDSVADCERQLCRKFRKTVPDRFKQALSDGERSLALHDGRSKLGWAEMMRLAQAEDRHHRDRRDERSSESDPEPDCSVWYSRPKPSFDFQTHKPSLHRERKNVKVSFGRTFQNSSRYSPPPKKEFNKNNPPTVDIPQCNWCGKRGHLEASCWAKTGACNICGSTNHDRNGCPRFDSSWSGFSPKCSGCGGPHLGRDCDQSSN